MNCPDCDNTQMTVEEFTPNRDRDMFEAVWKCPSCRGVFLATIYRCIVKGKGGGGEEEN